MIKNTLSDASTIPRLWVAQARHRRIVLERDSRFFRWRERAAASDRRRPLRAVAAAVLLIACARGARASFDLPAISARSAALGGASLAGQGDSAALFQNAAAGAGLRAPETYLMYNKLYAGLDGAASLGQGLATLGVPTRFGVVGVGLADFQASSLLEERVVGVTFARRWFDAVEAGVTGKYLYHRYMIGGDALAASDPVFRNGTSRGAFALDFGLSAPVSDALRIGLSMRNLNAPDVGLAAVDRVPREVQAALAYDVEPWALRWTADYTYRDVPSGTFQDRSRPGLGLEKGFEHDLVKFRVGATLDQFSGGIGVAFGPMELDYTFLLARTLVSGNAGTHMVGLRYRFGDAAHSGTGSH